jgi:hypothetical protein
MGSKKKKFKGVGYISSVLRKYTAKKYPKLTSEVRNKSSEILAKLKESNQKVTVQNILSYVRKKREDKFVPSLPPEMEQVRDYFELVNYPDYIITEVDRRITLISKVSKEGLPIIRGLDDVDYQTYFADFVNYCNSLMENQETYEGSGNIFVTCELIDAKKYVYQIIACDKYGKEFDYGFDRKNPQAQPTKGKLIELKGGEKPTEKTAEKPIEKPAEDKSPTTEVDKEIELSKQRQKESEQKEKESESQRKLLKEKLDAIKELKSLGFANDEIIKMLGI